MSVLIHRLGPGTSPRLAGQRPLGRRARRIGLAVFCVSIAVNAALGIYAVLAPGFGETQGKILGTSLCLTGAVLLALACEPAWERGLVGPVPHVGAALGAIGFAFAISLIWTQPESETWAKIMMTVFTLSVACVAASLLALSRLAPRHTWIFTVTLALLALGAGMYSVLPWLNDPGEWYARSLGVVMIALAAFVVTVPVLHWVDRGALALAGSATGAVRFCPYCGRELTGPIAGVDLTCGRCGRGFRVASTDEKGESSANLT
jgi:hypothetical protein